METEFERREVNSDEAATKALLTSPYTIIEQSDDGPACFSGLVTVTPLISCPIGVRGKQIMSLEDAIRKLRCEC